MKNSLFNVLLKDKNVNTYTKVLIILNMLAYNNDFYIPNKKLINILKKYEVNISIRFLQKTIEELYLNKLIYIHYIGNKRYFSLNFYNNKKKVEKKESEEIKFNEDFDWLNEE